MTVDLEEAKDYWQGIGMVLISDSSGSIVVGHIIDVNSVYIIIRDTSRRRHWINVDAIVKIMELEIDGGM